MIGDNKDIEGEFIDDFNGCIIEGVLVSKHCISMVLKDKNGHRPNWIIFYHEKGKKLKDLKGEMCWNIGC